jgi:hypothetical protein
MHSSLRTNRAVIVVRVTILPADRPVGPGTRGSTRSPDGRTRRGQEGAPVRRGTRHDPTFRDGLDQHGAGPAKWHAKGHLPARVFLAPNVSVSVPLTSTARGTWPLPCHRTSGSGRREVCDWRMPCARSPTILAPPTVKIGVPGPISLHIYSEIAGTPQAIAPEHRALWCSGRSGRNRRIPPVDAWNMRGKVVRPGGSRAMLRRHNFCKICERRMAYSKLRTFPLMSLVPNGRELRFAPPEAVIRREGGSRGRRCQNHLYRPHTKSAPRAARMGVRLVVCLPWRWSWKEPRGRTPSGRPAWIARPCVIGCTASTKAVWMA